MKHSMYYAPLKRRIAFDLNDPMLNRVKKQTAMSDGRITVDAKQEVLLTAWMKLSSRPWFTALSRSAPFFGFIMWVYNSLAPGIGGWAHLGYIYAFAIATLGLCRAERTFRWAARIVMVLCVYGMLVNFTEALDRHEVCFPWASHQRQ